MTEDAGKKGKLALTDIINAVRVRRVIGLELCNDYGTGTTG